MTPSTSRPHNGHPRQFDPEPDSPSLAPNKDANLTFTIEAIYGGKRSFDFDDLKPTSLAWVFAEALQRASANSGTIGATSTVMQYEKAIRKFFAYLAAGGDGTVHPHDLRARHIDGFEQWLQSLGKSPLHRHQILLAPIN